MRPRWYEGPFFWWWVGAFCVFLLGASLFVSTLLEEPRVRVVKIHITR